MSSHGGVGQTSASRKRGRDANTDEFSDVRRALQAMETTFITIHDLTYDANILYASTSITDVLDFRPDEVVGRSCWQYFHPEEIPFAKAIHGRGIELDKASVLNYCRIKNKQGDWIGCECVFTVVYNVLIGCTSIYMDGPKAKKRAVEAPVVRQLFSSSPRDPRYHMLQYISSKFASGPRPHLHEPRAAIFLNRFTRTLTINFATNGLENLLGIPASELKDQSFYYCIQENCLAEAIRCLESAKANDSIAYLRFWFRDPRVDRVSLHEEIIDDADGSSSDDDGGVQIAPRIQVDGDTNGSPPEQAVHSDSSAPPSAAGGPSLAPQNGDESRHSSGNSTDLGQDSSNAMFDQSPNHRPSTPRSVMSLDSPELHTPERPAQQERQNGTRQRSQPNQQNGSQNRPHREVELEAVVSCTSDGLVVIMRAARPFVPDSIRVPPQRTVSPYSNGLFASPWATTPIMPDPSRFPSYIPTTSARANAGPVLPSMGTHPSFSSSAPGHTAEPATSSTGPPLVDFMNSIRDVAVFAWALTGINGSLQSYGRGRPLMGAIPHTGLPIWDPDGSLAKKERSNGTTKVQDVGDGVITSADPRYGATKQAKGLADGTNGVDEVHGVDGIEGNGTAGADHSKAESVDGVDRIDHKPTHNTTGPIASQHPDNNQLTDGIGKDIPQVDGLNGIQSVGEQPDLGDKLPQVKEAEVDGDNSTTR